MTHKSMVLRAEHDSRHKEDCAVIEIVVSGGEGCDEDAETCIDALLDLHSTIWGQTPDRIWRTSADTPPPIDPNDDATLVWPDERSGIKELKLKLEDLQDVIERQARDKKEYQDYIMAQAQFIGALLVALPKKHRKRFQANYKSMFNERF